MPKAKSAKHYTDSGKTQENQQINRQTDRHADIQKECNRFL